MPTSEFTTKLGIVLICPALTLNNLRPMLNIKHVIHQCYVVTSLYLHRTAFLYSILQKKIYKSLILARYILIKQYLHFLETMKFSVTVRAICAVALC